MAAAVGAEPNQVIFTSGGTEADNLAVIGAALAAGAAGRPMHAAACAIEHKAVLAAAHAVTRLGGAEIDPPGGPPRRRSTSRRSTRRSRPRRPWCRSCG